MFYSRFALQFISQLKYQLGMAALLMSGVALAVPTGSIVHPRNNTTYTSNLTLFFNASDTTTINSVGLTFGDATTGNQVTFCNGNCNSRYRGFRTGVRPVDFGLNPGQNTIHLWANSPDNILSTASFNWQPREISSVSAERSLTDINVNWSSLTGYLRYNAYIATEPGVTPTNFSTLENGQVFRSLRNTEFTIDNADPQTSYYIRITGVDATGESAFSAEEIVPALNNTLPVAQGDQFTLNEDTALSNNVLSNDNDPDNDDPTTPTQTLIASVVTEPGNGTLTFEENGDFTYTPNTNFNGSDSFTYQIEDDFEGLAQAQVQLQITPVNDSPVATADTFTVNEDTTLTQPANSLTINDNDIDGDAISVSTQPAQAPGSGIVVINSNGGFTYTPNDDFNGADSFSYTLLDGQGGTDTGVVQISVLPVADAPVVNNDVADVFAGSDVVINVLANDQNPDGGQNQLIIANAQANNGVVAINNNISLTYTPNTGFSGTDTITYEVQQIGTGLSTTGFVNVTVEIPAQPPVANDDIANTNEDVAVLINVLGNDTDPNSDALSITSASASVGSVTNNGANLTYTPALNFNGTATISYTVSDGTGLSDTGNVSVTINPVDDAPVINNETADANAGETLEIDVLSNDINLDGQDSNLIIVSASANNGVVSIVNQRLLSYTANSDFEGQDSVSYTVRDGGNPDGPANSGTLTVNVVIPNRAPVATDDTATTNEDTPVAINVLANDSDPNNDPLAIANASADSGSVSVNTDNSLLFTPDDDFNGVATITYTINDPDGLTATASVVVNVSAVNDAPVAEADSFELNEDTPLTVPGGTLISNDTDPDNDTLSVTSTVQPPLFGSLQLSADGGFTYTPNENFNGSDSFVYGLSDGNGGEATATVSLTILPVADAPETQDDTFSVEAGVAIEMDVLANDTNIDQDQSSLSIVDASALNGSVEIIGSTLLSYVANIDFTGTDTITYTAQVSGNASNPTATGSVSVEVLAPNLPPVANEDSATVEEDSSVNISPLSNDVDPENDAISLISASTDNGTVEVSGDTLIYTPTENFNGAATINYAIEDIRENSASGTINVTVSPVNDDPVTSPDSGTTAEDTAITLNVVQNDTDIDGDNLSLVSASASDGSVQILNVNELRYTPRGDFSGADTISYDIFDGNGGQATGTVSVTITPVNDAPRAQDDSFTIDDGTAVTLNPLANDSDPEGDNLTITSATANYGSVSITNSTTLTYTPPVSFTHSDIINYTVADSTGANDSAQITVSPSNAAPQVSNDTYILNDLGDSVVINTNEGVLRNDSDPEGTTLTAKIISNPAYSSNFLFFSDGSFSYLHDGSNNLADSFTYEASDGTATTTGTVSITVHRYNDLPSLCTIPPQHVTEGELYSYQMEVDDLDYYTLFYSADNLPSWLSLDPNTGAITGTPPVGTSDATNITLKVDDGEAVTDVHNFSISVHEEFGTNNELALDLGGVTTRVNAVKRDNLGRIVAVGERDDAFLVIRLLPDGSFDNSFDDDGVVTIPFAGEAWADDVAIDKQNYIVVIGQTIDAMNEDAEIGIARLTDKGALDTSFSDDGFLEVDIDSDSPDYPAAVVLHDNGDISVAAYFDNSGNKDVAVIQVENDGTLDNSFNSTGILTYTYPDDQIFEQMRHDGNHHLMLVGTHHNGTDSDILLAQIDLDVNGDGVEDGAWDTSFDSNGFETINLGSDESATDFIINAFGDWIVAGGSNNKFGVFSFDNTGSLNTSSFNANTGYIEYDFAGMMGEYAHAIQDDGAGNFFVFGKVGDDLGIIKLTASGTLDGTFASGGEFSATVISGSLPSLSNDNTGVSNIPRLAASVAPTTISGLAHEDSRISATRDANGQFIFTGSDTFTNQLLFFKKVESFDIAYDTCDIGLAYRNHGGSSTKSEDNIVDVLEGAQSEFYAIGYGPLYTGANNDLIISKINPASADIDDFGDHGIARIGFGGHFTTKAAVVTSTLDVITAAEYNANYIKVAKVNASGELDSSYASSGYQDFGGSEDSPPFDMVIDSNDSVIIGASTISTSNLKLFKLTSSGALDTTFGSGNDGSELYGSFELAHDMAITSSGGVYVAGEDYTGGTPAIMKVNADGSIDTNFGINGVLGIDTTTLGPITVLSDDSVIAVTEDYDGIVIRKYSSTGTLVTSFGDNGLFLKSHYSLGTGSAVYSDGNDNIFAMVVDDSAPVVALSVNSNSQINTEFAEVASTGANHVLLKINSNGQSDASFVNAGEATLTNLINTWGFVRGFSPESTGQFVVYGEDNFDFALAHMDTDGTIIHDEGELYLDFGTGEHSYSMAVAANRKLYIAGSSSEPSSTVSSHALTRMATDGQADFAFNTSDGVHVESNAFEQYFSDITINGRNQVVVSGTDHQSSAAARYNAGLTTVDSTFNSGVLSVITDVNTDTINAHVVDDMGVIWQAGQQSSVGHVFKRLPSGSDHSGFGDLTGEINGELNLLGDSELFGITSAADGNLVAAGIAKSGSIYYSFLVKFDRDGAIVTNFGSNGFVTISDANYAIILNDIALDSEGNFVAVGEANSQAFAIRVDNSGNELNRATLSNSTSEQASSLAIDKFGAIFVASHSASGFHLYRLKPNLTIINQYPRRQFGDLYKSRDVVVDDIGNVYVTGSAQFSAEWDIFVLKYPSASGKFDD